SRRLALGTGEEALAAADGKGGRGPEPGLPGGPLVRRERVYNADFRGAKFYNNLGWDRAVFAQKIGWLATARLIGLSCPVGSGARGFERRYDGGGAPDTQRRQSFGLPVAPGGSGHLRRWY